jgi:hypothetical protein
MARDLFSVKTFVFFSSFVVPPLIKTEGLGFFIIGVPELTAHGYRYIAAERTWTYSKHILRDRYPASLLARRLDLQKTQLPLLLRVGPCLQSCCLGNALSKSVAI